jgi:YjbE family integral membrane protein
VDLEIITSLLLIIGIDVVLGGDNAIVIALACRNLPERQRNKAILLGTMLAVLLRISLTIIAVYLLKIPFLQFVGGCFLLLIAYKLLTDNEDESSKIKGGVSLLTAIKTIVLADLVMGLDNVIAVAGAAHGRLYLVIFGLVFSIPIIIWGSKLILFVMERFPVFIYAGAGILAYTAGKMIIHEDKLLYLYQEHQLIANAFPFISILLVVLCGFISNRIRVLVS